MPRPTPVVRVLALFASGCLMACSDGSDSSSDPVTPWTVTRDTVGSNHVQSLELAGDHLFILYTENDGLGGTRTYLEKRRTSDGSLVTGFGYGGGIAINPQPGERNTAKDVAVAGGGVFILMDERPGLGPRDTEWRVEKRDSTTGVPDPEFGSEGVVVTRITTDDDPPNVIAADDEFIYLGGNDLSGRLWQWRVEKRRQDDGSLVQAFAVDGVYQQDYSNDNDGVNNLVILGDRLLVGGNDREFGSVQWRLNLLSSLDGTPDAVFGARGTVTSDPTMFHETLTAVAVDGDAIYVAGFDRQPGQTDAQWRLEKRLFPDGRLDPTFGVGGVILVNPGPNDDILRGVAVSDDQLWVLGEVKRSNGDDFWRLEKRSPIDGSLDPSFESGGILTVDRSTEGDRARGLALGPRSLFLGTVESINGDTRGHIQRMPS